MLAIKEWFYLKLVFLLLFFFNLILAVSRLCLLAALAAALWWTKRKKCDISDLEGNSRLPIYAATKVVFIQEKKKIPGGDQKEKKICFMLSKRWFLFEQVGRSMKNIQVFWASIDTVSLE